VLGCWAASVGEEVATAGLAQERKKTRACGKREINKPARPKLREGRRKGISFSF
jgi:hypothetical protein